MDSDKIPRDIRRIGRIIEIYRTIGVTFGVAILSYSKMQGFHKIYFILMVKVCVWRGGDGANAYYNFLQHNIYM